MAMMAFTFTSCEDVPEPFGQPINPNQSEETIDPAGDGTAASPYNVAAAIAKCKEVGEAGSSEKYYIKGIVVEGGEIPAGDTYGNITFKIADTPTSKNMFMAYQVFGSEGVHLPNGYKVEVGAEIVLYGPIVNYKNNTPETQGKGAAHIVTINGKPTGGEEPTPSGEAKAVSVADFLKAAVNTTDFYQLTGTVKNLKDGDQYGNFDLEDATGSVYVYGLLSEKGGEKKKFQELVAAKGIANGKKITIIGNRGEYNSNPQVTNAYFVKIEDGEGSGENTGAAKGTGTKADPFNIAAAIAKCQEVGETASTEKYYIKGIVVKGGKASGGYGNVTFDMGDTKESTELFKAYQVAGTDGAKLADGYEVKAGDEVVIYGPVVNYKGNTPETTGKSAAQIVTINGKSTEDNAGGGESGGNGSDVSGNEITIVFSTLGFENAAEMTKITLTDGTTLTFDGGGNTNTPKYYNTGTNIRIYAKNTMTINAGSKKIATIEITCDTYNGTIYNASGDVTANGTKMTIDGSLLKSTGLNESKVTIANTSTQTGAPSQLRMTQLKITYAN
jgi:hypothetical protein